MFQPHRYTRTASIGPQFADAFAGADALVLTDVYPAGETPIPGVSGRVDPARGARPAPRRCRSPTSRVAADLVAVPTRYARPGDLVLTLGAGDLTTMPDVWLGSAVMSRTEPLGAELAAELARALARAVQTQRARRRR